MFLSPSPPLFGRPLGEAEGTTNTSVFLACLQTIAYLKKKRISRTFDVAFRSDVERKEQSIVGCCYVNERERVRHVRRRRRRNRRLRRGIESSPPFSCRPMNSDDRYTMTAAMTTTTSTAKRQQQRHVIIIIPRIYRVLGNGCDVYARSALYR